MSSIGSTGQCRRTHGQSPHIARWLAGGTSRFPETPPLVRSADRPLHGRRRPVDALGLGSARQRLLLEQHAKRL